MAKTKTTAAHDFITEAQTALTRARALIGTMPAIRDVRDADDALVSALASVAAALAAYDRALGR